MAIHGVDTKCYILALFVRDDGERFLLGSGHYEFKDTQMHFAANAIQNDIVEVQGNDGFLLAGQVRRPGTQSFDGYVGDGTLSKQDTEAYRRQFFSFFRKNFFYKVIYVFSDGTAIQRKRGFLVDDPTVQELYQIYPEYHVALNFEDVNYYSYSEDDEGHEQYAEEATIDLSSMRATGGLEWDNLGVIWEAMQWGGEQSVSGAELTIQNNLDIMVPTKDEKIEGDTEQQTYSGKNLLNIPDGTFSQNGITWTRSGNIANGSGVSTNNYCDLFNDTTCSFPAGTYTLTIQNPISQRITLYLREANSTRHSYNINAGSTFVTFTTNYDAVKQHVTLAGFSSGDTISVSLALQLENGSAATSFEPFVGGVPAPNPDYPQNVNVVTGRQVVEVKNKNLFYLPNSETRNDVTFTKNPDGTFDLFGVPSANTNFSIVVEGKLESGEYTLSRDTGNFNLAVQDYNSSGWLSQLLTLNNASKSTGSIDPVGTRTGFVIQAKVGVNYDLKNVQVQLEKGSSNTDFVSCTKENYEINLGKNLFDKNNPNVIVGTVEAGGYNASGSNKSFYLKCESNTTYTIQKRNDGDTNRFIIATANTIPVQGTAMSGLTQKNNDSSVTITTGNDAKYIVCTFYRTTEATLTEQELIDSIQVEVGSTATSYAPYFEPIELCKIGDYQDYIYRDEEGDWYVYKAIGKITYTGNSSENWQYSSTSSGPFRIAIPNSKYHTSNDVAPLVFTNYYTPVAWSLITSYNYAVTAFNNNVLPFRNTDITSLDAWKAWLGSHNMTVYYPFATSSDTKITDATLISQLNRLGSMKLFVGENNLSVLPSTNLPASLSFKYYTTVEATGSGAIWEEGGSGGATVVEVDSITNVYPIWKVKGPVINPELSVITTNTTLQYNGTITGTQTLEVDMFNKTAKLNGVSVIGNISGDWVNFLPGTNRVIYTADNADALPSTIEWQEVVG